MMPLFSKKCLTLLTLVALSLPQCYVRAGQEIQVNIEVTLIRPPCTLAKDIDVNFGSSVVVTRIDGNYKKQTINYSLNCVGASSSSLKMSIIGNGADFDKSSLETGQSDLGVALYSNGTRFPLNSYISFDSHQLPVLEAVLVKRNGSVLKEGDFRAGATLSVEYQ